MKTNFLNMNRKVVRVVVLTILSAALGMGLPGLALGQGAPSDFSPGLQEIVSLAKAGMSDSFIQTYVTNSGRTYNLSADDIVYMHQNGVSDTVIQSLMSPAGQGNSTPGTPPSSVTGAAASAPAAQATVVDNVVGGPPPQDATAAAMAPVTDPNFTPTMDYFQSQLSPYGNWVNVAGFGLCWQPDVVADWRPYCDGGNWVYTDSGWYWNSEYPWGGVVFHYGRWTYTTVGWVWVPGYQFAPAWVLWRNDPTDGDVGWAPLPPGAMYVDGGWQYNGMAVGMGYDFGLGVNYFNFVGYGNFCGGNYRSCLLSGWAFNSAFNRSQLANGFDEYGGRFFDGGINRNLMAGYTHQDIPMQRMDNVRQSEFQRWHAGGMVNQGGGVNRWGGGGFRSNVGNQNQWHQGGGGFNNFHGSVNDYNNQTIGSSGIWGRNQGGNVQSSWGGGVNRGAYGGVSTSTFATRGTDPATHTWGYGFMNENAYPHHGSEALASSSRWQNSSFASSGSSFASRGMNFGSESHSFGGAVHSDGGGFHSSVSSGGSSFSGGSFSGGSHGGGGFGGGGGGFGGGHGR